MDSEDKKRRMNQPCGLIASLRIVHPDGTEDTIRTDESWEWARSRILFSEIYDGETCDARIEPADWQAAKPLAWSLVFSNIVWGQRGNFLDVPTDCPQRDERLGWTGDAQVFIRTASYLFDTERFFKKWLHDLAADQRESGEIGQVIPDLMPEVPGSAAWGDAATICPWQVYQTYGDRTVLEDQFESMRRWVDFIGAVTKVRYELETPVRTRVCLNGQETWIDPGKHTFWTVK